MVRNGISCFVPSWLRWGATGKSSTLIGAKLKHEPVFGRQGALFDPLNSSAGGRSIGGGGSPAGLDGSAGAGGRREETPEDKIKAMEKKVNELIEESCFANSKGNAVVSSKRTQIVDSEYSTDHFFCQITTTQIRPTYVSFLDGSGSLI